MRKSFFEKGFRILSRVQFCKNVLSFAQANDEQSQWLGITGEEWDSDIWLLGCINGVIDLRTGEFRDGRPEDYIRTVAPTEWKGINEPCPLWDKSVRTIFDGDQETVDHLQCLFGYGITGETRERINPIFWGADGV